MGWWASAHAKSIRVFRCKKTVTQLYRHIAERFAKDALPAEKTRSLKIVVRKNFMASTHIRAEKTISMKFFSCPFEHFVVQKESLAYPGSLTPYPLKKFEINFPKTRLDKQNYGITSVPSLAKRLAFFYIRDHFLHGCVVA